jgi:autotransporter strand-loop-strand O-heptosyltransferase
MAVTNNYDQYIHCDVKDTRENQTGHNYRVWIDKWCNDILTFDVYFYDLHDGDKMIYHSILNQGMYAKVPKLYFGMYRIEIKMDGELLWKYTTNWNKKKVFLRLETGAIGDLLAFIPQIEKFRQKYDLDLRVFHGGASGNGLNFIKDAYPGITFTENRTPGNVHKHIVLACNSLRSWNQDGKKPIPEDDHLFAGIEDTIVPNIYGKNIWQQIPLQQVASDALGLEYEPMRPRIKLHPSISTRSNFPEKKYVCIASQSTAQIKYWNYGFKPNENRDYGQGWREVIEWLKKEKGYDVVVINQHKVFGNQEEKWGQYNEHSFDTIKVNGDVILKPNASLIDRIIDIKNCEFFMGLNSGMSWVAYALKVPIVAIMALNKREEIFGVNDPLIKTLHIHDYNKKACGDCFKRYTFNRHWTWCPEHKGTNRMFECTSLITPDMVKEKCEELIGELNEKPTT